MAIEFLSEDPWADITPALSEPKRAKAYAAISYIGRHAPSHLPLVHGDVLVCNASISAIKSGATNLDALLRYIQAGVEVFNAKKLHAKVIACGSSAWVGSANASDNSAGELYEAAVRIDTKREVTQVVAMVEQLMHVSAPIDEKEIKALRPLVGKRSGSFPPADWTIPREPLGLPTQISRLHVFLFDEYVWSKDEEQEFDLHRHRAQAKQRRSGRAATVDAARVGDSEARVPIGDWFCWEDDRWVYAPVQVFDFSGFGNSALEWHYKLRNIQPRIKRQVFDARVKELGLRRSPQTGTITGKRISKLLEIFEKQPKL